MSSDHPPLDLNSLAELTLLLHCARTRVAPERAEQIRALTSDEIDWDYLLKTGQHHKVLPLLCRNLDTLCPEAVPAKVLAELKKRCLDQAQCNLLLTGEMFRLLDELEAAGVRAIPFKGPSLASLYYGNLALRQFEDIDLLVEPEAVPCAADVLSAAGYQSSDHLTPGQLRCCSRYANSLNFAHHRSSVAVDLHWGVWPDWFSARENSAFLRTGAKVVSLCGRNVLSASAENTLLMLCLHGAKHAWPTLSSACDIHELLASSPELDWQYLMTRARELQAERLFLLGLILTHRLLETPLPEPIQKQVSSAPVVSCMAEAVMNRLFTKSAAPEATSIPGVLLRARTGLAQKLACLLRFLFRPGLIDICWIRLPYSLFPLYFLIRPVRLLAKYGVRIPAGETLRGSIRACFLLVCLLIAAHATPCAGADDVIRLSTEAVPSPLAAQAILDQTVRETTLRLGPMDLFPHAAVSTAYDDNLLISHINRLDDVEWSLAPGLMVALGDVSSSLMGPVSIDRLRSLLYYSLADEQFKPRRFLGLDYTPAINLYTEHDQYNNVDQAVRLSGGYNLSRMTLGLDFDFFYGQVKDTGVGDLVTIGNYDARLRTRYDLSEITSLEVNGQYLRFDYIYPQYQGYQDFRNQNWLDRQLGDKLSVALGFGFGYLQPQSDPEQTYEQGLLRAVYHLTGKSYFSASGGVEVRQFRTTAPDAVRPVFDVTGVFQPWVNTVFTIEGHRHEDPAPFLQENYLQLGGSANVRQLLFNRFYFSLGGGYDHIDYTDIASDNSRVRTDNYWFVTVNLDYQVDQRWTATLFYTYRTDDSTENQLSYYNNLVGVRIGWKY